MKKLAVILSFVLASATMSMAQAPQAFAFQSTLTDTLGNPYANQTVSVQFDVHSGSGAGPVVYSETHSTVATSASGYFTANVGEGTPVTGTFPGISWGAGTYWLEVSVDTTGGSSYVSLGASQLLSVPYALYSGSTGATPAVFQYVNSNYVTVAAETAVTLTPDIDLDAAGSPMQAGGYITIPATGVYRVECTYGNQSFSYNGTLMLDGSPVMGPTPTFSYDQLVQLTAGQVYHISVDGPDTHQITLRITQVR